MKQLLILMMVISFAACKEGDYIKQSVKVKKIGDCNQKAEGFKMNSNIDGERYEFDECFDDPFDGTAIKATRVGKDTIIVTIPTLKTTNASMYHVIIDIDAYPKYHHIQIGDQMFEVAGASSN